MVEEPKADLRNAAGEAVSGTRPALDAAGEALGNALRLSFRILTVVMLFLFALFLVGGIFIVQSDEMAIIVRFGEARSDLVMSEGVHYAFPYPIDEVVGIWTKPRTLQINTFWPKLTEVERIALAEGRKKKEEIEEYVEGSENAFILTGDLNVLQSRWEVTYAIRGIGMSEAAVKDAIVSYYTKIGLGEEYKYDDKKRYEEERRLIRVLLQTAVIQQIGRTEVDAVYPLRAENPLPELVKRSMNAVLTDLDCGLQVQQVNIIDIRPPEEVKPAFDAVLAADSTARKSITNAEQAAEGVLIAAAGEVSRDLGAAIDEWWTARNAGDAAGLKSKEEKIRKLFEKAGGRVRETLVEAIAYKKSMVEEARSDADQIKRLRELPPDVVKTFLDHARVEVLQEVLKNCYEIFLFRPMGGDTRGICEIWLGRRAELLREKKAELEKGR